VSRHCITHTVLRTNPVAYYKPWR